MKTNNLHEKAVKATERLLERKGYDIIETNWHGEDGGQIDLVALDDGVLVIMVDIKARSGIDRGLPLENVATSRDHMELDAAKWLAAHADNEDFVDRAIRFDIVSLLVISEDRAFLRLHVNALGAGGAITD